MNPADQEQRPLADFVERFMTAQTAHYDRLVARSVRQIEELGLSDAAKQWLVERVRAMLSADLDRVAREVSALVARGMRTDEALH